MSAKTIPPGSMWLVEYKPGEAYGYETGYPIRAARRPSVSPWRYPESDGHVLIPCGTTFVVGETHREVRPSGGHVEFVEVLLPIHAYINRTIFNEGLGYLKRIA